MKEVEMNDMPKEQTLIKRNNILRGIVVKDKENGDLDILTYKQTTDSIKLYNYIYLNFQNNREILRETGRFSMVFPHALMRDHLDVKTNSYIELVKTALQSLLKTTISIKNFTIENKIVKEYQTNLITEWIDYIDETTNQRVFKVSIAETLFEEMMKIGPEFTELNLKNIKVLTSLKHIKLYELMKSYQNMKIIPGMSLNELNNLFLTNFINLGKAEELLRRAIKAINLKTDITLSYTKDKKLKKIYFQIEKIKQTTKELKLQKYAINQNIDEKTIIDNILDNN
jgi:plasmid replication initiation protein